MKTLYKIILMLIFLAVFYSCAVTEKSQRSIKISLIAGLNKGGITENTDLSVVPDAMPTDEATIDAYSGETRIGINAGIHANKPLKFGEIESGLDYMYNYQTFTYADKGNMYIGVRNLSVSQIMVPLTYNFNLLKRSLPEAEIQLKLGYMAQINLVNEEGTGILPEYEINKWSNGALFGISAYPLKFKNGSKLGFYIDGYRGSQIYEDYYNLKSFEMPGSSFLKYGIRYRF